MKPIILDPAAMVHDVRHREKIGFDRAVRRVFERWNWRAAAESWREKINNNRQTEMRLK